MRNLLKSMVLVLCLVLLVTACGNNNEPAASSSSAASPAAASPSEAAVTDLPPPEKTKLVMRLNWKIKGEFVPFIVAKENGIFKKYGLDVDVFEGAGSVKTMQSVAQGTDDFGVTSSIEPMQGIEQGIKIKMIASYMTKSPLLVISYPDNPIKSPKDMEGKKVGTSANSVFAAIFDKLVSTNDADPSKAELVKVDDAAKNNLFMSKELDGIEVFATNEYPFFEDKLGIKLETMYTADFGFDIAGLMLIASDEFLAANPNTTKRFIAAVSEGYRYSFEHPEEAAAIAKKVFPEAIDEKLTIEQIKRTHELADFTGKPYGWIDESNLDTTASGLLATGLIESKKDISEYYTNEYITDK